MQQDSSPVQPEAPNAPAAPLGDRWRGLVRQVGRAAKRTNGSGQPGGITGRVWPIMAIFVLSGAAGLVYEVVWSRQLVLVFGNTTQAVSAILTGFFGGMAIGSALGGRLADRVRRPLRMYGVLELLLVVVVLLTPLTFLLIHDIYRGAFGALVANPQLLALVRFGLSLVALGPATILLGATLPTLTRYLSRDAAGLSAAFGRLYAVNTCGAIIGTIVAGFVLIELLGLSGALRVGAGCSALAGLVALLLDRVWNPGTADAGSPSPARAPAQDERAATRQVPHPRLRLALIVAYVSGLTSLGYQVLWTRLLASGTGNSTYVFTMILAVFLVGLALGAAAFTLLRPRIRTIDLLAVGQIVIALLVLLGMVAVISHTTPGVITLTASYRTLVKKFVLPVMLVVLPTTFVLGLTFPASSALVADPEGRVGTNTGLLLSANTLGAITGTFLIPFLVIPLVGSPVALGLIALVNVATGLALALAGRIETPSVRRLTAGVGVVAALVLVLCLSLGSVFVDPNVAWLRSHGGTVAMSLEDEIASVQAGSAVGHQQLWVTGTSMTLKTVDVKLMPILPLILRPNSKTDLTIAFGMGSAYRAALNAGLTATAVELVPSVPKTFGYFYDDAPQVLANPTGHIVIADGRNYVELTDQQYDIIVVDPPPPIYTAGVSVISSLEFYQEAQARLTSGGVMMQWVPYIGPTLDDLKAHLRTFHSVFPYMIVVFGSGGNGLYMLGSAQPITFDPAAIQQVLSRPNIVQDISSAFDSPQHDLAGWAALIPTLVWMQGDQIAKFTGPGPLVTDDHPLPEYFLLRHLFGPPSPGIARPFLQALTPAP
jgi:spermidine synthase